MDRVNRYGVKFEHMLFELGNVIAKKRPIINKHAKVKCANNTELCVYHRCPIGMSISESGIKSASTNSYNFFKLQIYLTGIQEGNIDLILGIDFISSMNELGLDFSMNLAQNIIKFGSLTFPILKSHYKLQTFMIHKKFSFLPKIQIQLNGQYLVALLDSGSTISYCKRSITKFCKIKPIKAVNITAQVANGSEFKFIGNLSANLEIAGININAQLFVAEDNHCPCEILIGTDIMGQINKLGGDLKLNFATKTVNMENYDVDMVNALKVFENYSAKESDEQNTKCYNIKLARNERIVARSDNVVEAKIEGFDELCDKEKKSVTVLISSNFRSPNGIIIGKSVCNVKNGIFVRIMNVTAGTIKLYKNQRIAYATVLDPSVEDNFNCVFTLKENDANPEMEHNYIPPEADVNDLLPMYEQNNENLNEFCKKIKLEDSIFSESNCTNWMQTYLKVK